MPHIKNINFTTDPWTTVLGLLIALAALVSVFVPSLGINWTEASVGILLGLGIAGLKDKGLGAGNGGGTAAAFLLVSLTCLTLVSCSEKHVPKSSETSNTTDSSWTKVVERVVEVPVPGDTVVLAPIQLPCPEASIDAAKAKGLRKGITQTKGRAKATIRLTDKNELEVRCDCSAWVVKLVQTEKEVGQLKKLLRVVTNTKEVEVSPWWAIYTLYWTIATLIAIIIYLIIKFVL